MKKLIPLTLAAALVAPAAFAGTMAAPIAEPPVTVRAPAAPMMVDWTGPYAGATLGFARTRSQEQREVDDNGVTRTVREFFREGQFGAAAHVGYNMDMGNWVAGGEFALAPGFNQTVGNREVRWGAAARLKAGPKLGAGGETWAFGSIGLTHARHRPEGGGDTTSSNGWTVGVGASHMVQENIFVSGEINHNRFSGDARVRSTGATVGVSFRF